MGSPFPGMNPYLENPTTWPNLHSRFIVAVANLLGPKVRPKYRVVVEEAVYRRDESDQAVLIGVPDISVCFSGALSPESTEVYSRRLTTGLLKGQNPSSSRAS
ncbi:MAG: hypothetical protein DCF15_05775 [Phormidesmis priestleyi]|uniref:DUF4058 domain-containing protein n=1 Tax=Phormidesmis priestleyi TaxID=268141 RepID=A0A2W4XV23_9CYAN|nr:MAG: hypothetical protein DCF15_05775 [Phormidesmis priestleyi]